MLYDRIVIKFATTDTPYASKMHSENIKCIMSFDFTLLYKNV